MTLVGYWPLHESSGDALDHSGNENHGTVNGATQGASGILGETAYDFDGTDDYVNTVPLNNIIPAEGSATLSGWFKFNTTTNIYEGVSDYDGSNADNDNAIGIGVDDGTWAGNSGIYVRLFRGEGSSTNQRHHLSSNESIDSTIWYHVCITIDSSVNTAKVYRNGKEFSSVTFDGVPQFQEDHDSENCAYFIGGENRGDGYGNNYTPFTRSGLRLYNRALSPHEVQYLYEVGKSGHYVSSKKTL